MKKYLLAIVLVLILPLNVYAFENLEKGSAGGNVKEIQEILIDLGYLSGTADGQFGGMTEEAVKKYQENRGI